MHHEGENHSASLPVEPSLVKSSTSFALDCNHEWCCVIQIDSGICWESCGRARTPMIGATSSKPTDGICCESCMLHRDFHDRRCRNHLISLAEGGHKDLHTRYFFNVKNERMWLEGGQ